MGLRLDCNLVRKIGRFHVPVIHGAAAKKRIKLVWQSHQLLSGFLTIGHLPRLSRQSANDNSDNEMIPGAVHRSPGICLTAEKKPQLGDRLMKFVRPVIASNVRWVSLTSK